MLKGLLTTRRDSEDKLTIFSHTRRGAMSPNHPFLRGQEPADPAARGDRNVAQDLDNIFRLTAAPAAPQPAAAQVQPPAERARAPLARRVSQPDLEGALDMLNRAGKAMELMQARYQQIEDYAKGVADRAEKDIATAFGQAREWELRAAGNDEQLEALRHRADMAERRAEAAEQAAREARDWLECFYDKIVSSFDTRTFLKTQAA